MGILKNIQIDLQTDRVTDALLRGSDKQFLDAHVEKAVETARGLIRPAAVFAWGRVKIIDTETLRLQWMERDLATVLHSGPHTDLMAAAEIALVSVATIGPELDDQARRLHGAGESLLAYLLDCVGVVALGEAGQALRNLAEERAAEKKWGVGPSVSPGSLDGWALEEQPKLCAGLDLDTIGVQVNASGVLVPYKSASGLIGIGPGYTSNKAGSVCRFCMHAKTCWRADLSGSP
jgi:hypothetical protein